MQNISLGALPLTKDNRDAVHLPSATPLPNSYVTDTSMLPVLMQAKIPACVSHAVTNLMKFYWFKKTGKVIDFSPRFLDLLSWTHDLDITNGRDPRLVISIAKKIGCCTTALLPNDTSLPLEQYRDKTVITQAMKDEAAQYKIPGFKFINLNEYDLKDAIYNYGMIAILSRIGNEWWTPSWNKKDIDPLRIPKNAVGGHETCLKGWDNDTFRLLNEWSTAWADNGENDMPFPQWLPYIYGAIAIVNENPMFKFTKTLKFGMIDNEVRELQKRLNIIQTGFFGILTRNAVKKYQLNKGLVADGIVGPLTRAELNS